MEQADVGVVPDSIEPYVGFKYLSLIDGVLVSNCGYDRWPTRSRAVAECKAQGQYKWQALKQATVSTPESVQALFHQMNPVYSYIPYPSAIAKPTLELPHGYVWSYEQERFDHEPADESCSCGFYAVDEKKDCAPYAAMHNGVLVEVAIWGKVVVGDTGARGQYAYPQRIIASPEMAEAATTAGEAYGIPVEIDETVPAPYGTQSRGNTGKLMAVAANVAALSINLVFVAQHPSLPLINVGASVITAGSLGFLLRGFRR